MQRSRSWWFVIVLFILCIVVCCERFFYDLLRDCADDGDNNEGEGFNLSFDLEMVAFYLQTKFFELFLIICDFGYGV